MITYFHINNMLGICMNLKMSYNESIISETDHTHTFVKASMPLKTSFGSVSRLL